MKGCRQHKLYAARWRSALKRVCWDDLAIFKFERCKKWRKQNRRARDGSHGKAAGYVEKEEPNGQ